MVSKNNVQLKDRYSTKQVPHYGIRKLSVGVASVLLSTTLYMGVTASADTVSEPSGQPAVSQPTSAATGTSTSDTTADTQLKSTADQSADTATGTSTSDTTADATADTQLKSTADQSADTAAGTSTSDTTADATADTQLKSTADQSADTAAGTSTDSTTATSTNPSEPSKAETNTSSAPTTANNSETVNTPTSVMPVGSQPAKPVALTTYSTPTSTAVTDSTASVAQGIKDTGVGGTFNSDLVNYQYKAKTSSITFVGTNFMDLGDNYTRDLSREATINFSLQGKFTLDSATIRKDHDILLGTVLATNNFYPDPYIYQHNQYFRNYRHEHFPVTINGREIGYAELKYGTYNGKNSEAELNWWLHVTSDDEYASDVNINLALPSVGSLGYFTDLSVYRNVTLDKPWVETVQTPDHIYKFTYKLPNYKDAYQHNLNKVGRNQGAIGYSKWAPAIQTSDVYPSIIVQSSMGKEAPSDATFGNYKFVIKISGIGVPTTIRGLNFENTFFVVDQSNRLTNEKIGYYGSIPSKIIQEGDHMTAQQLYDQVEEHQILYSIQDDGSLLIATEVTPADIYTPDELITDEILKHGSILYNTASPDDQKKILANTLEFYHGVLKNTPINTYAYFVTDDGNNYANAIIDGEIEDVTPASSGRPNSHSIHYTLNGPTTSASGDLLQHNYVYYIDGAEGNKVISTTDLAGKVGDTKAITLTIPTGYVLDQARTGSTPASYVLKDGNNTPIYIYLKHMTVQVIPDQPKTMNDKLPDNPTKNYPAGVEASDLNETITRTIKVTTPDGQTQTVTQAVKLTRTADVDEVTGEVTYGSWTTGEWANYDVPTIPGYTASQTSVAAAPVDGNAKDQTVNITYTANSQTIYINYVDDDKAEKIVYTATATGKIGETVSLNLTVPDKYQLADGQQLPTTYEVFAEGSQIVTIHLVHQVVQREATVDVQLELTTIVDNGVVDDGELTIAVTQNHWKQLDDEIKDSKSPSSDKVFPLLKIGTLTGHVNYDLVDNKVVSFADDWTSLNLGGQTYQMPDGTEVVNGVSIGGKLWGKSLKEQLLKYYPDTDPDYVNRAWYGYLSVNATNEIDPSGYNGNDLQVGLAGNEPNALAKANGDQAATAVKTANKTIDSNWLEDNSHDFEFSERDGQLRGDAFVTVVGVYIPYVEKTATRTINITTPDGKTKTVTQTATLAKQIDFSESAHPAWTTGEWTNYDVPTIPGYTASQSNVAKETVTGTTEDQTVNITYTANPHQISINYVDDDQGEKVVGTGTVNGKTGSEVTITPSLPSGYMLTPGKDAPSTYTVTAGDNQVVTIHVQKQFVDTSATDPQAKQTRTVTLHYVYGAGDKQGQKAFDDAVLDVYYHRTATLDRATNKTTYGDWLWDQHQGDPSTPGYHVVSGKWTNLPQHWANIIADVPSIKGYHADLGQNDPANTNHVPSNVWVYPTWNGAGSTGETLDGHESKAYQTSAPLYEVQPEHTVKYMPNKTTLTVNYVDDDNKGAIVSSQHWDGTTGQHIDLTLTPPDNYVLSPGWGNSINYDFDGVNNVWYNVHVKRAVQTQTVTSQLTIHYVDSEDHEHELKDPTVITRQYTRTNISHNDGTTQYGDWSYVPGSFKQTGTPITVDDSDNPVKQDNVDRDGENMDSFTMIARYPTIEDYSMHDGINGARLIDWLGNSDNQAATMTGSVYAKYDEAKERSVNVKFVDDQHDEQQVGQAITLTGRNGDTADLKLTVPDKYQLANGQQLPTSYAFTKGSGDLVIHLTHKVVQREATIDVQMGLVTLVRIDDAELPYVITQNQWTQLDDELKDNSQISDKLYPSVKIGTLTGHVDYDLVDNQVMSFNDDWTSLNLGGRTYQMPDGTEVVNGISIDSPGSYGKSFKEDLLKYYPDVDPDYVNRTWHGYLSANETNKIASGPTSNDLQAGLVGNEPNTLAKVIGDQAVMAVKTTNKTIDLSLLQRSYFETRDFSEQNGRLQGIATLLIGGVYIPYVEKTATRTINVTTPDGKTTAFKQTVTLAKQVDFGKDAHPTWTTDEWTNYDVPTIPGYTASQANVANETVTGETKDQTVEITYTANPQITTVIYQAEDGTPVHTTTVNGKTGQTVKVSNEVPAGWRVVNGNVPSEITFGPDGTPKTVVTIAHSRVTVTPDAPKTTGDKLPDNPGKSYPAGVGETDLNKVVTGTIKLTMPDGQVKTVVKTAHLTRTADVDEVTGEVTYSDWTTGYWSAYTAPSVPGYTANYPYIAGQAVTGMTQDQTLEINYTANPQATHVNYLDGNGKVVYATTVNGHTNQTVDVPSEVPTGWKLVDGQTVPSTITFGPDGHADTSVKIEHRHVMVTPDKPQTNGTKLPDNPVQSFHGVEASDLNKTATRTIKVTTPDGQTKTVAQTVKLTRTATVDEVAGDVTYSNWSTGQWAKYDVPAVNGYTATQTEVAATAVDERTTDQTVDVSYTPNKQTTTVKYVDDKGEVVHTTTVDGVTNQTVTVPSEVPAGWTIVKGQVPSELTFGTNGHEPIEFTVAHHHVTVTPDHPQTNGTKLPDNPAKTFNGVEANDLNKTITRTIKVTTPDGQTKTVTETTKLTRSADVDEVTGEVTYGDWTTGEWAAYDVPSVSGYTPSQTKIDKEIVTADSKDTTTTITYTPIQYQISVKYVDDDNHGKIVKTDQVPGKTDQTITIAPSAPANYDLVDNGNRTYTVTSADGQAVQIHVKHHQVTTSESKTVARTINVHTPHDGVKTVKQTVELNRDVTTDQVTGDKTYGDWTTGQWKAYTPEAIPGYTPSTNEVPTVNVDGSSTDQAVDVTYTANAQHVDIVYADDAKDGAVVKTDQVVGKTDETVKVTPNVPTGYKVVGEVPGSYTMTADGHQTITVHLVHQMKTASESKTVTRTINVYTPHDGTTVFKQTVDLNRDVMTDQVTGDKIYGDWSTTEWTYYDVPVVAGYTPSIKQVTQQVVDGMTKDQTVNVTYTANAQTTHVSYVDGDGNVVYTTTIIGKTDQTVKVPNEIPAGWKVVGEPVPTEITFGPDGHADVTVIVGHQHVTVTPDQPKTPADKLPNNPGKTYPDGVGHNDLNRTVTRTIKVVTPDGQTNTVTQKVQLTRTADIDEVTGKVTYGKWTTGEWTSYKVPSVPGYTPSQSDVPAVNVTDTIKDQMLILTYTANDQTTHVNYVDGDGKTVHTTTVTGKTDQTVTVSNEVPTGWTITDGQVPAEITFGPDGHADVTVTVGHQHVMVTPDQPKTPSDKLPNNPGKTYPAGVGHDDLNKTVTRTIKVATPDGKTQTTEQKVQLTRTADVDEVTGDVIYGKWTTGEWANYNVPTVPGYTASQSEVPTAKVTDSTKDQTVTVTYTANAQTTTISYIDQNGETVHTTVVNGHTDQTVKVPNETPAGWTITDGQVPTEITFGPNGYDRVTVTVDHKHVAVTPDKPQADGTKLPDNPSQTFYGVAETDLNKTITRTIEVTVPTGKTNTIKQTATLIRTADVDEVTGEVTYGKWTTGAWSSYSVPTVPGYTPSQLVVAEAAVYADKTDQMVKITYTADSHTTHINYVDEAGNVVHSTTVTGQTDQTVNVPNETPAGWMIITGQVPSEVTFGADGHTDVTVSIDHQTVTVTPDQPQADGTKLPDNPTLIFRGVDEGDLNKTVTRTIKLNVSGQAPQVITQTARLTRTANVDEATGEVTYGDWTSGQWDTYEVPTVDGYTASQTTIPAVKVTSETTSQAITVDYVAVPAAQTTLSNNQTDEIRVTSEKVVTVANGTVQETKQDAIKNSGQSTMQDTKQLPQTGNDKQAGLLSLVGSSLMASLAIFGLGKKKKHEN